MTVSPCDAHTRFVVAASLIELMKVGDATSASTGDGAPADIRSIPASCGPSGWSIFQYRRTEGCEKRLYKHIRRDDPGRWKILVVRRYVVTDEQGPAELSDTDEEERGMRANQPPEDQYGFPRVGQLQDSVSGSACAPWADSEADPIQSTSLTEVLMRVDVSEVFSPPRAILEAKKYGLKPGEAWDLTEGWDFDKKEHREAATAYLEREEPLVLIGSPPYTAFCQLQSMNPNTAERRTKWRQGVEHMKFVVGLYRQQVQAGRVFLHEQPAHAKS